ncbi:hypothetical protein BKA70DRAFT_1445849 [Coprinopsis sp. MPI-PUGE-AT-0042]|nr:hypothetical protein BKA70DRAFT_1445849 [Coprinopsis sp. MPI-PUGE-AT-0042]
MSKHVDVLTNGCIDSDFNLYGDMDAFRVHPGWQRRLSGIALVQHTSEIDKEDFFILGEVTGGDTLHWSQSHLVSLVDACNTIFIGNDLLNLRVESSTRSLRLEPVTSMSSGGPAENGTIQTVLCTSITSLGLYVVPDIPLLCCGEEPMTISLATVPPIASTAPELWLFRSTTAGSPCETACFQQPNETVPSPSPATKTKITTTTAEVASTSPQARGDDLPDISGHRTRVLTIDAAFASLQTPCTEPCAQDSNTARLGEVRGFVQQISRTLYQTHAVILISRFRINRGGKALRTGRLTCQQSQEILYTYDERLANLDPPGRDTSKPGRMTIGSRTTLRIHPWKACTHEGCWQVFRAAGKWRHEETYAHRVACVLPSLTPNGVELLREAVVEHRRYKRKECCFALDAIHGVYFHHLGPYTSGGLRAKVTRLGGMTFASAARSARNLGSIGFDMRPGSTLQFPGRRGLSYAMGSLPPSPVRNGREPSLSALREWQPDVMASIQCFSCMLTKVLNVIPIRIDKATLPWLAVAYKPGGQAVRRLRPT